MRLAFRQTHLYRFVNMVCPTGFEPAAFRVGVIRPSSRKVLRRKGLVGVAQISAILKKNSEALSDRASEVFRGSSQIVVCAPRRSCDSVHLCDLIDELFHVLDIGVRCVLRIDLR